MTRPGLEQGYVICPSDKRLLLLFTFLKKNRKKKVMVFFSSCLSVKYHHELFNYIDLPVLCIHGKQKQTKRTTTFFQYCNSETGILLCTGLPTNFFLASFFVRKIIDLPGGQMNDPSSGICFPPSNSLVSVSDP